MKNFVLALKLLGAYILMFAVFGCLAWLVVPEDRGTFKLKYDGEKQQERLAQRIPSTVMPTHTLWLEGDSPYSHPQKCINGTMYVYDDRGMALYVSAGNDGLPADGSQIMLYTIAEVKGKKAFVGAGKGTLSAVNATVTFTPSQAPKTPLIFDTYNDSKVYESSVGILMEYASMHAVENKPCPAVTDSELAEATKLAGPDGIENYDADRQAEYQQQRRELNVAASHSRPVFIGMIVLIVVLGIGYIKLRDWREDAQSDIRKSPVSCKMSSDGTTMTVGPTMPTLPSWFGMVQWLSVGAVGVEIAAFSIPSLAKVILASGFSQFLYGLGFVVLALVLLVLQFCIFGLLEECIGIAEGREEDTKGLLPQLVDMGAVVWFNFMGLMMSVGAGNILPLVIANLCVSVPLAVADWQRCYGRTSMHWMQLLNNAFMWMSLGVLVAAWMCVMAMLSLIKMNQASDEAAERAAARRREQEGNSFILSDGNGGTMTMQRIGDTDDFACSDGHTYTRDGGSSNCYGDYMRRY